jgi:hypothetical protein
MCCRSCYGNQNLAATRAAPFDKEENRGAEVLCTGCDAIMNRATELCDMSADGRFKCSNGSDCKLDPIKNVRGKSVFQDQSARKASKKPGMVWCRGDPGLLADFFFTFFTSSKFCFLFFLEKTAFL